MANDKNATKKILVVDDELRMRRVIVDYLSIKGYDMAEAGDGEQALAVFAEQRPDLVLLDVMMPKMDGYTVCKKLREMSDVPVIMLTAKTEEEDELAGFSLGADEYIGKPFSLKILLARVEAVFRRRQDPAGGSAGQPRQFAGLSVNPESREVRVDGVPVELTYTEFELLSYLMLNSGMALSRDRILDTVWRYDYFGDARTVDTHIKKLRSKLGGRGEYIKTIRGVGYKFES
ncbi:MAG: response regulator transcription factor [Oscillospiraceae bacterium]|nr:response regulator transcription factor [Oscillospiraceae bacterium]